MCLLKGVCLKSSLKNGLSFSIANFYFVSTYPKTKIASFVLNSFHQDSGQIYLPMFDFILFTGWAPTRRLRDVIWGLNSLFTDLLNFDDPLNIAAAEHYQRDKDAFRLKTKQWVAKYAKR